MILGAGKRSTSNVLVSHLIGLGKILRSRKQNQSSPGLLSRKSGWSTLGRLLFILDFYARSFMLNSHRNEWSF